MILLRQPMKVQIMTHPDAIIIGTGVIGTAIAFEMAKLGWKTVSLDRNTQIGLSLIHI